MIYNFKNIIEDFNCIICNKKMKPHFYDYSFSYHAYISYFIYKYDENYFALKGKGELLFINKKTLKINPNTNRFVSSMHRLRCKCTTCPYILEFRSNDLQNYILDFLSVKITLNKNSSVDIDQYYYNNNFIRESVNTYVYGIFMGKYTKELRINFDLIKPNFNKSKLKKVIKNAITFC